MAKYVRHKNFEALLDRASEPTVHTMSELVAGSSPCVQSMLLDISARFSQPGYSASQMKKKLRVNFRLLQHFHAAVGLHPGQLIRECRMETALRLLWGTPVPVDDIAVLIGFEFEGSLGRLSKRWCGMKPSELRAHLRPLRAELVEIPDVFSWYFWERYRCGALRREELAAAIEYLERRLTS